VPLSRSAEAVEHVLRLASAQGVTHARIALKPQELGSVDVHIRSTNEGIVARVVAHSAESVQTLQHAANDLRRSLEEQGVNVLSLDISQADERSATRSGSGGAELASGKREQADDQAASDETPTTTSTLRLPSGVLVDVLA
jgi:flagellar hook-length control protein FliK